MTAFSHALLYVSWPLGLLRLSSALVVGDCASSVASVREGDVRTWNGLEPHDPGAEADAVDPLIVSHTSISLGSALCMYVLLL